MEFPRYCDTPQWADPLNSWPEYSIVGSESGGRVEDIWFTEERKGPRYEEFMGMLRKQDEEITALIMSIIQSGMLK